jgi:hypothetical protein
MRMALPTPVPEASFLGAYVRSGAFTDCYVTSVAGTVTMAEFIFAFYTTPLFKAERWLLAKALNIASTDQQALQLAGASSGRFSAWTVENRSNEEILLDAGQTRSWLSVKPQASPNPSTALLFGSAVVPMRPDGKFGFMFHALLGFHRAYSKLLLAAAARRVIALRNAQSAT